MTGCFQEKQTKTLQQQQRQRRLDRKTDGEKTSEKNENIKCFSISMCLHFLVFVIFFLATFHDARKQNVVNKEEEVVRSILWKLLNPKEKFPFCWRKQYQSEDLKVWRCQGGLLFSILDFVGRIYVCLDFLHFPLMFIQ